MTIHIPREFRCEVKIGAKSKDGLVALLCDLAEHLKDKIPESLERLRITGVAGPDGSEIKIVKSPIEVVTELGGGKADE